MKVSQTVREMSEMKKPKYFCVGLTEDSFRPVPNAEFEIQILDDIGRGERIVFFNYASTESLAVWDACNGRLSSSDHTIPVAIVDATRNRCNWPGYHLDENGEIMLPSFLCPTSESLNAVRQQSIRKSADGPNLPLIPAIGRGITQEEIDDACDAE